MKSKYLKTIYCSIISSNETKDIRGIWTNKQLVLQVSGGGGGVSGVVGDGCPPLPPCRSSPGHLCKTETINWYHFSFETSPSRSLNFFFRSNYITKVMFCQNIVSQTAQCPFYFVNFQKVDYGSQNI